MGAPLQQRSGGLRGRLGGYAALCPWATNVLLGNAFLVVLIALLSCRCVGLAVSERELLAATATPLPSVVPTAVPRPTFAESIRPTPTIVPTETALPQPTPMVTETNESAWPLALVEAQVVRIIDGDTIEVSINGERFTVRYIGIDTPETVHPDQPVEWMGPEATAANQALILGKTVYLEKDISETDRYGRLLRYVWLADGTLVNEALVQQGYAAASSYPPDVKYQERFRIAQQVAREAERGLWGPVPTELLSRADTVPLDTALPAEAKVTIEGVDKRAEYVDIANHGDQPRDLTGWLLVSERGNQVCALSGILQPGQTLRIWALAADADKGGFNCGFSSNIWNNSESDPAALYDQTGNLVDRYPR